MDASELISKRIEELDDWRGAELNRLRKFIREAAPELTEDWKWDTPLWTHNGNVVAVGAFKDYLKINFFKGASLKDPNKLFNAGLEAKATRAIDIHQGDKVNETALKDLILQAVALNSGKPSKKPKK